MTRFFTVLFTLFLTITTFGQDTNNEKHPIDIKREQCLYTDSNQTTYGMMECEAIARDEWNDEMNKYYKLLMNTLTTEQQENLVIAQKHWIYYRDKEFDFSNRMYYDKEGTLWKIVATGRQCEIVKQRALDLKVYYETLSFD